MTQKQAINEELIQVKSRKEVVQLAEEEQVRRGILKQMEAIQSELSKKGLMEEPTQSCSADLKKSLTESMALQDELKSIAIKAGMTEQDAEVYQYQI